ncbi:MAG: hypothetical protein HY753_08175 [Nitrospirae bacterium]|nr:hypothetical protein [Nitrospirota bacterium]
MKYCKLLYLSALIFILNSCASPLHIKTSELEAYGDKIAGELGFNAIPIFKDTRSGKVWFARKTAVDIKNNQMIKKYTERDMLINVGTLPIECCFLAPAKINDSSIVLNSGEYAVLLSGKWRKSFKANDWKDFIDNDKKSDNVADVPKIISADVHEVVGMEVYASSNNLELRPEPQLSSTKGPRVTFGEKLITLKKEGDWFLVRLLETHKEGWVHKSTVISSKNTINDMKKIGAIPTNIIFIENITNSNSYDLGIISGGLRLGNKRMLAEHGNSIVFADEKVLYTIDEISMQKLGVIEPILKPRPLITYFYNSKENKFRAIDELIINGDKIVAGPPIPKEPAVIDVLDKSIFPIYSGELIGQYPVRIINPNNFEVNVGLRSQGKGKDFRVSATGRETAYVPNGDYEIYFQYSTDIDALYRGDNFTIINNGIEIQIVKVIDGNYGIKKIK